jgi:hypothetical protein
MLMWWKNSVAWLIASKKAKILKFKLRESAFMFPARAVFSIEHERGDGEEELEFQFKWKKTA